ncbi:serine hydrolase [Hymenobacter sp. B81]|uniref:serine hydrolase n=1 Tax=Hymenobacter sp. B81 TaxID=3344878 RepID=UPI0037DC2113
MNRFFALFLLGLAGPTAASAQPGNPLKQLLRRDTTAAVRRVLDAAKGHRVQILYTQIRRDAQGRPSFKTYAYRLRPTEYFYPASTVKLPTAALALEELHEGRAAIGRGRALRPTRETPLQIDSAYAGQTRVRADSTAPGNRPTIGHYIRKVLLVSDNDAYNRLYEFIGYNTLQALLGRRQLGATRIVHRLSVGDKAPASGQTNPFTFFLDSAGHSVPYPMSAQYKTDHLWPAPLRLPGIDVGHAYLQNGQQVEKPMNFGDKNFFPLAKQQQVLRALLFPDFVPASQRFNLRPDDYALLRRYLSLPPRLSRFPQYNPAEYPDNYAKFLLVGGPPAPLPEGVRIYNKIGQAYGFLIDNACVVDSLRGVEFLLSAVVYCNRDGVLNDDQYDYDAVGFPFMRRLGQLIYDHELQRTSPRRTAQVRAYWSALHERSEP